MEYSTSGSSLSMRGGDDFTSINEVLDRAVLIDTTQTITGSKTYADTTTQQFNGEVRFGTDGFQFAEGSLRIGANTALSIDVDSLDKMNISSSTTTLDNTTTNLRSGGTTKYTQNATASTITNATINLQDATPTIRFTQTNGTTTITNTDIATNGILTQTGNFTAKGATITLQDTTPTTHYLQSSTATSLTNDTINLSSGGVVDPKYRQTGTLTIIDNDEIRLRYRVANKLVQTSVATTITNTDIATNGILTQTGDFTAKGATITLQDATPTTKYLQTSSATTLNNTTTTIQSGGTTKYTQNATASTLTNATINLQDATAITRFTQTSGTTTITNTNIGTNGILTQTGSATLSGATITLQDATPTTKYLQTSTATTLTNTNIATNGILTQTGNFTAKGATITLQDDTPSTHFSQTNVNTTINNAGINIQVDGVNHIVCSTDNVAMNAELSTEGYYLGVSGAKTSPLISFALNLFPQNYNTTASQLVVGYPDGDPAQVVYSIRFPYRVRCVGFSVSGDGDAHAAVDLTLTIGNNLAGAVTRYFRMTGSLAANALQNSSATANILGVGSSITSISVVNDVEIPIGTRVYFYEETSASMATEMSFVFYFSQVI